MDCLFCKIAQGEIPSSTVYENDHFRVFLDMNQAIEGHLLVVCKEHYETVFDMPRELFHEGMDLAQKMALAAEKALGCDGANILINSGESAGQSVRHAHIHVLPRKNGDGRLYALKEVQVSSQEMAVTAEKIKNSL